MALSPREAEVLAAVARHRSNADIAADLVISVRTVETHVSSLLRKLGASNRRELADRAASALTRPAERVVGDALLGREDELGRLLELVRTGAPVTVTGPGGAGKTSLARCVSDAVVVDLARLPADSGRTAVAELAVETLALRLSPRRDPVDAVVAELVRRSGLLVLDSCEHVLAGAAALCAAVVALPGGRVVATSRQRLGLPGERVLDLGGLPADAAAALFRARASDLDPPVVVGLDESDGVAAVCAAVDYLPLAIELAASRLRQLSLSDLRLALGEGHDVLDGGDPTVPRHRSIRALLDWSHALLAEDDQHLHRRLGVLRGPFRMETATAVAGDRGSVAASVARLVDACLLVRDGAGYRQLDLVRAHASYLLDEHDERGLVADRLLAWAEEVLDAGVVAPDPTGLRAAAESAAAGDTGRGVAMLRRLSTHWASSRSWRDAVAAREAAARLSGDPADALAAAELGLSCWRGDDAWRLYDLALRLASSTDGDRSTTRVQALAGQVELATRFPATLASTPPDGSVEALVAAIGEVDDAGDLATRSRAACARGWAAVTSGDHVTARQEAEHAAALARAAGDAALESAALDAASGAAWGECDATAFAEASRRRLGLRDRLTGGPRAELESSDLDTMAVDAALAVGDFGDAGLRASGLVDQEQRRGLLHVGLGRLATAEFHLGRFDDALGHTASALEWWREQGAGPAGYLVTPVLACEAIEGYRGADGARWVSAAATVSTRPDAVGGSALARALRADVHLFHGRVEMATTLVEDPPHVFEGLHRATYAAVRAVVLGGAAVDDAAALVRGNRWAEGVLARARGDHVRALRVFEECGGAFESARTRVDLRPDDPDERRRLDDLLRGRSAPGAVSPSS